MLSDDRMNNQQMDYEPRMNAQNNPINTENLLNMSKVQEFNQKKYPARENDTNNNMQNKEAKLSNFIVNRQNLKQRQQICQGKQPLHSQQKQNIQINNKTEYIKKLTIKRKEKNTKKVGVCRICLQSQQLKLQENQEQNKYMSLNFGGRSKNRIIQLPCSCKDQLGMIHEHCIKFWIKIWLQDKIKNNDFDSQRNQRRNTVNHQYFGNSQQNSYQHRQFTTNFPFSLEGSNPNQHTFGPLAQSRPISTPHSSLHPPSVKPLTLKKLSQNTLYPFDCQICHKSFYFNLLYHRRAKSFYETKKKQLAIFFIALFFSLLVLGICLNWIFQYGFNIYVLIFFIFLEIPIFSVTVANFVWTFTKHQFWIKDIFSYQQVINLQNEKLKQRRQKQKQVISKTLKQSNLNKKQKQKALKDITKQKLIKVQELRQKFREKYKTKKKEKSMIEIKGKNQQRLQTFKQAKKDSKQNLKLNLFNQNSTQTNHRIKEQPLQNVQIQIQLQPQQQQQQQVKIQQNLPQ